MNFSDQQEKNVEQISSTADAIQSSNNSEHASLATSFQDDSSSGDEESSCKGPRLRSDGKRHVEKGSLTEEALVEAKLQAQNKRKHGVVTEEDKREERRAANRLSAFQSRLRRKLIIQDLGKTVAQLCRENTEQRQNNAILQKQIEELRSENERLRQQVRAATTSIRNSPTTDANSFVNTTATNNNPPPPATQLLAILQLLGAQQQQTAERQLHQQPQPTTFPPAASANQDVSQLLCTVSNLVNHQNPLNANQHASVPTGFPPGIFPTPLSATLPSMQQPNTGNLTLEQQLALLHALSSQKKE